MKLLHAIPALPVSDMDRGLAFYRDTLGFALVHQETGFAIVERDGVQLHLWGATDESWRTCSSSGGEKSPVVSGAESFIAGTASCRIGVVGIDELYQQIEPLGVLHSNAHITDQPWGDRDFGVTDPDNNLVTFFERRSA